MSTVLAGLLHRRYLVVLCARAASSAAGRPTLQSRLERTSSAAQDLLHCGDTAQGSKALVATAPYVARICPTGVVQRIVGRLNPRCTGIAIPACTPARTLSGYAPHLSSLCRCNLCT